jgi:hypothetical protein
MPCSLNIDEMVGLVIQVLGAVIISGTPGIEEPMAREKRVKEDHAISQSLLQLGVESFIPMWYQKQMWFRFEIRYLRN